MIILVVKGRDWIDYTLIQATVLRDKPQGVTVIHDTDWGEPGHILWRYNPNLIWGFTDTLPNSRVEKIMDLGADRQIPSTHYWHGGSRRYGW